MVGFFELGEADYGDEEAQLFKVKGSFEGSGDNIRVAVRPRPPNKREQAGEGGGVVVSVDPSSSVVTMEGAPPFTYDDAFDMDTPQLAVFEALGIDFVACAFHGYNASLFAYGQTSSGKSFSMMGVPGTALVGLIPRIVRLLFRVIETADDREVLVEASYLEIYNEKLRDLFGTDAQTQLKVREHRTLGVHVAGLTRMVVDSEEETLAALELGTKQRTTAATLFNIESSRSHAVFEVNVQSKYQVRGVDMRCTSRLSLIDLAGSERSDKLGSKGTALQEGNSINKSLTVLGRCIRALVEISGAKTKQQSSQVVPFRDSVLTYYLRDSLAGNAKTTMLAAVSPVRSNMSETMSTLRYAASAKNIKTAAKKNEDPAQAKIRELSSEIETLKARLAAAEAGGATAAVGAMAEIGRRASLAAVKGVTKGLRFEGDADEEGGQRYSPEEEAEELLEMEKRVAEFESGFEDQKREAQSVRRGTSLPRAAAQILAETYPMLSCLNKDDMLSHAMQIPLGANLPFTIGRDSDSAKNDFVLNGMGIASSHCVFERVDDDSGGITLRSRGKGAEVVVNGEGAPEDGGAVRLAHGDRVVLGPGRLLAVFAEQPLTLDEKAAWTYEAAFSELALGAMGPLKLMSPVRRSVAEECAAAFTQQCAQANAIACEMGTSIRFIPHVVVRGSAGFDRPGILLDEFLQENTPHVVVTCVFDANAPPIDTAGALAAAVRSYQSGQVRTRRLSLREGSAGLAASAADDTALAPAYESLFEVSLGDFDILLSEISATHGGLSSLAGGLSDGADGEDVVSRIMDVYDALLTPGGGYTVSRDELSRGVLAFNSSGDAEDVLTMVRLSLEDEEEEEEEEEWCACVCACGHALPFHA